MSLVKRILIAGVLLLTLLFGLFLYKLKATGTDKTLTSLLHRAQSFDYWNDGNYKQAIESVNAALEQTPDDDTLFSHRAECQIQLGNYKEALADYDRAIELCQLLKRKVKGDLAKEYDQLPQSTKDKTAEAISYISLKDWKYHFGRGWSLYLLERNKEADLAYTNGINLSAQVTPRTGEDKTKFQSDRSTGFLGRARVRRALKMTKEALEDAKESAKLDPKVTRRFSFGQWSSEIQAPSKKLSKKTIVQ